MDSSEFLGSHANSSQPSQGSDLGNITLPDDLPVTYPVDAISRLIQLKADLYREIFANEDVPVAIESRFKDLDEEPMCAVEYKQISPHMLERVSDKKPMIIAQDYKNNILQKIRVVHCRWVTMDWVYSTKRIFLNSLIRIFSLPRNLDSKCPFSENLPILYQAHCRQEVGERKLFVYSPEEGKIQSEIFFVPACCTCQISHHG